MQINSNPNHPSKPHLSLAKRLENKIHEKVDAFTSGVHALADETREAYQAAGSASSFKEAAVTGLAAGADVGGKVARSVASPAAILLTAAMPAVLGPAAPALVLVAGALGGSEVGFKLANAATNATIGSYDDHKYTGEGTDPNAGHALLNVARAAAPLAGGVAGAIAGAHNPITQIYGIYGCAKIGVELAGNLIGGLAGLGVASLTYGAHKASDFFHHHSN